MVLLLTFLMVASVLSGCGASSKLAGRADHWVTWSTVAAEMETFNFQFSQNAKEIDVLSNCFDGLTTNDRDGALVACLAEKWNTPDGGKTWTFNLRKGVPWVDYKGKKQAEVIAEDFLWGLEWVLNYGKNESVNTSMPRQLLKGATEYYEYTKSLGEESKKLDLTKFKEMVGISAPDDYTLKFECIDKYPYFQTVTVYNCLSPVSGKLLSAVGVDGYKAIAFDKLWYNGPYTISTYVQNNEKVLTKNPLYWDSAVKLFKTVTIKMVESTDTAFQMFQSNQLDVVTLTEATLQTIYRDKNHKYNGNLCESRPSKYSTQLHLCYDKKLVDGKPDTNWNKAIANEAFRLALYRGVDWTDYLARTNAITPLKCTNLCYTAANLVTTSTGKDYTELVREKIGMQPSTEKYVRYDAAKGSEYKQQAMKELKAQGVTFPVDFDYYISAGNQTSLDSATVLKNVFAKSLGEDFIRFNIKTYVASYAKEVRVPQLHSATINGWGADFGDPINFLGQEIVGDDNAYYASTTSMANNITDPKLIAVYKEFTRQVQVANAITDNLDKRYAAFADAEAYMLEHALVIPVFVSIPWQLTHANDYSKIYCAYGTQNTRYINWETKKDLYKTAEYEEAAKAFATRKTK